MSHTTLTVGQIGCGAFARAQHLPNIHERNDLRLKYCCDVNAEMAAKCAAEYGAEQAVSDFNTILHDPEIDFVSIATPHDMHLPIIREAAARGIHVFCEKPMAMTVPDCWEILRTAKRGNIKICVDLNRRMAPALQALRQKWLAQCAHPRHSEWRYIESEREEFPEEQKTNLLIRVQDESSSYRMIHLDPSHGGGSIIGESVHWLDLACWFFAPQRPVEITAWGSTRLSHGINLSFSGGDSATIVFNVCGTFDYPKELFEVTSRAALFRSLFFVQNDYYGIPESPSEKFPLQRDDFQSRIPEEGFESFLQKCDLRNRLSQGNIRNSNDTLLVDKGHRAMLDAFVRAIRDNSPSPCSELDGLHSTLLARSAIESIRLRQTLPVSVEEWLPAIF